MKATVYLETTICSYYVSRPSRDILILAHQQMTRSWWERRLSFFDAYISATVVEEAARGEPEMARQRRSSVPPKN